MPAASLFTCPRRLISASICCSLALKPSFSRFQSSMAALCSTRSCRTCLILSVRKPCVSPSCFRKGSMFLSKG
ncbi:uncharacterized protein GGS25DRAFT_489474 [Hypoxylon fragiforme]|uniref:uncharacterized protein n=1 Tax=Hypoxylon fragiforme TaxID=63214 RepID=UPI0020C6056E|nr:uncharacterized protein GGS25DRAFT_489474 [Hypoxylon fragiforme]KAI2608268.1 hypothetical protein GGS25DRAFT_489474 [Hypoxylon fragiforme]